MQDEMMDLMDVSNEIQETLGRSYNVPDDIDEEELMGGKAYIGTSNFSWLVCRAMYIDKPYTSLGRWKKKILLVCHSHILFLENAELDALEADMDFESESVPSYLQPDQESELNLPAAPTGHAAPPHQQQVVKIVRS